MEVGGKGGQVCLVGGRSVQGELGQKCDFKGEVSLLCAMVAS